MDDLRLASLLCARLCHDLIGPVGAVNNGLELLADEVPEAPADIVELLVESGGEASRRLQFYRAAYGAARGGRTLDTARRVALGLFTSAKITLDWPEDAISAPGPGSALAEHPDFSRLVLNMVLCATEMLPRGGGIALRFAAAAGGAPCVTASGPATKVTDDMRLTLAGAADIAALDARAIGFYLTARLAAALGGSVELTTPAPDTVELRMILSPDA